jgi:hypothetical protein
MKRRVPSFAENNREKKETMKMPAFRRLPEGFMRCMRSHANMVILGFYFADSSSGAADRAHDKVASDASAGSAGMRFGSPVPGLLAARFRLSDFWLRLRQQPRHVSQFRNKSTTTNENVSLGLSP